MGIRYHIHRLLMTDSEILLYIVTDYYIWGQIVTNSNKNAPLWNVLHSCFCYFASTICFFDNWIYQMILHISQQWFIALRLSCIQNGREDLALSSNKNHFQPSKCFWYKALKHSNLKHPVGFSIFLINWLNLFHLLIPNF